MIKKIMPQGFLIKIALLFSILSLLGFLIIPHLQYIMEAGLSTDHSINPRSVDTIQTIPSMFGLYALLLILGYTFNLIFQRNLHLQRLAESIYQRVLAACQAMGISKRPLLWTILLLTAITFVFYRPYINRMFINDDFPYLRLAQKVNSWQDLGDIFPVHKGKFADFKFSSRVNPLTEMSFVGLRFLLGLTPRSYYGYRLVNLIFHLLNSLLVYLIVVRLSGNRFIAFWSTLIFATRASSAQAIFMMSTLNTRQMLLFLLLSFYFYIRGQGAKSVLASLFCFGLSVASKEEAVVLPAILLMYELVIKPDRRINFANIKSILRKTWGYILISGLYLLASFHNLKTALSTQSGLYSFNFRLNIIRNLLKYLSLPFNSNYDPLLLLLILFAAFFWLQSRPLLAEEGKPSFTNLIIFSLSWMLIGLLPVLFLRQPQEYYMYLPMALGSLMLAVPIYYFRTILLKKQHIIAAVFSVVVFGGVIAAYAYEFWGPHTKRRWFIFGSQIVTQCTEDILKMYPQLPKGGHIYILPGDSEQHLWGFATFTEGDELFKFIYNDHQLRTTFVYQYNKQALEGISEADIVLVYKNDHLYPYKPPN